MVLGHVGSRLLSFFFFFLKKKTKTVISWTGHPCKKEVNSKMAVMVLGSFSLLHIHNHFPPIHKHNITSSSSNTPKSQKNLLTRRRAIAFGPSLFVAVASSLTHLALAQQQQEDPLEQEEDRVVQLFQVLLLFLLLTLFLLFLHLFLGDILITIICSLSVTTSCCECGHLFHPFLLLF